MFVNWLYFHPGTFGAMFTPSMLKHSNVINAWVLAAGYLRTSLINLLVITPYTTNPIVQETYIGERGRAELF